MNIKMIRASLVVFALSATVAYGQDDKATVKEWSKKMKQLKPLEYKSLVEQKDELAMQVNQCQNSKGSLKDEIAIKDSEIANLRKEVEELKAAKPQAKSAATGKNNTRASGGKTIFDANKAPEKGVVYKVQIGSFRNKDLSKYFDNSPNFSGDIDSDGTKKYTLGAFGDYWEADNFKKALREMGVKGAWIVAYKDGKRVPIKDVLEGAL